MQHNQLATDLAARLEAATEPSRELSDAVLEAAGWRRGAVQPARDNGRPLLGWSSPPSGLWYPASERPHPTADLNAIVAMVEAALPGCGWQVTQRLDGRAPTASIQRRGTDKPFDIWVDTQAATPVLALSAALVRALTKE